MKLNLKPNEVLLVITPYGLAYLPTPSEFQSKLKEARFEPGSEVYRGTLIGQVGQAVVMPQTITGIS